MKMDFTLNYALPPHSFLYFFPPSHGFCSFIWHDSLELFFCENAFLRLMNFTMGCARCD